jgi:HEAT repeat protein
VKGIPGSGDAPRGPEGLSLMNAADEGDIDDTLWNVWWELNKHPYLRIKDHLYGPGMVSDGESFFLHGDASEPLLPPLRPGSEEIQGVVAPTLLQMLGTTRDDELLGQLLLALAKTGSADREATGAGDLGSAIEASLHGFIDHANAGVAERAILALGVLGRDSAAPELAALLEGKSSSAASRPSERERAFAAYALGLLGHQTPREDVRRYIVHKLSVELFRADGASRDVAVSCANAIGIVPLPLEGEPERAVHSPRAATASRQGQLGWLLEVFSDTQRKFLVRAHIPVALARLLEGVPAAHPIREEIRSALIDAIGPHSRAPREIQQGAAIALGQIGDADADGGDQAVARALERCVSGAGDPTVRNLALIALGQIACRPGGGPGDPLASLGRVRDYLIDQLANGRASARPWAALAVGVLGHGQLQLGRGVGPEIQGALAEQFERARSTHDLGALAVAVGLCDLDGELQRTTALLLHGGDEPTRGYAALGLGLLGQAASASSLLETLELADFRPLLARESAVALTLIGHQDLVPSLLARLSRAESLASLAAIAPALGWNGDARAIAPLCRMLSEAELPDLARAEMVWALGTICAGGDLPWYTVYSVNSHYLAAPPTLRSGSGLLDLP